MTDTAPPAGARIVLRDGEDRPTVVTDGRLVYKLDTFGQVTETVSMEHWRRATPPDRRGRGRRCRS